MSVSFNCRAIAALALFLIAQQIAHAGIDETYLKPNAKKSWGQISADLINYDGYQKSFALVVGISDYTGGYKPLPTENDAIRVRDFLIQEAGFDYVRTITEDEVTLESVRSAMLDEFRTKVGRNDRFLFYWSGHGIDVENAIGGTEGFLPVFNSPRKAIHTMVSMSDVRRWNFQIRAAQSLYLLDTCFSGLAGVAEKSSALKLDPSATREDNISQLARPSHHLISAGTQNEETIASSHWGGSLFTWALLQGLRGAADTQSVYPRDGVVSLSELIAYLKPTIEAERKGQNWRKKITPQLRSLRTNEGEFFFLTNDHKIDEFHQRGLSVGLEFEHGLPVSKSSKASDDGVVLPSPLTETIERDFDLVNQLDSQAALRVFLKKYGVLEQNFLVDLARTKLEESEIGAAPPEKKASSEDATETVNQANVTNEPFDRSAFARLIPDVDEGRTKKKTGSFPESEELALGLSQKEYQNLQISLNSIGFPVGPEDGVFGNNSREALRKYQIHAGIESTGFVSEETMRSLLESIEDVPRSFDGKWHLEFHRYNYNPTDPADINGRTLLMVATTRVRDGEMNIISNEVYSSVKPLFESFRGNIQPDGSFKIEAVIDYLFGATKAEKPREKLVRFNGKLPRLVPHGRSYEYKGPLLEKTSVPNDAVWAKLVLRRGQAM